MRVFISILGAKEETKLNGGMSAYFNIEIMVIPSFLQSFMCRVNIEDVKVFPQNFTEKIMFSGYQGHFSNHTQTKRLSL